jgi:hypothetical protein
MLYNSEDARAILRVQKYPVCVVDVMGRSRSMSGPEAAALVLDDVVGYGHRRRIKELRPSEHAVERARHARADLREVMLHDPRPEHVQRTPQERGAKTWVTQFVNARSGQAGGLRRSMRPRGR